MSKFLDKDGVLYLWGKIKAYVAKYVSEHSGGGSAENGEGDTYVVNAPVGTIIMWSGTEDEIPSGWVLCDGENGTPDLRGRFVLGAGGTYAVGATGGEATHTLTTQEMPSHKHGLRATRGVEQQTVYNNVCVNMFEYAYNQAETKTSGGGQAHNNMPPYYALCFIMKLTPDSSSGGGTADSVAWDNITDKPDVALKSDISTVYRYKGSVANYASLPTEENAVGDVWDVETTGMNYAWTGDEWDPLGETVQIESITNAEIDEITAEE